MTANFDAALARLDAFAERQLIARNTPGPAIGLTDRQRLLGVRTYGYANVDARQPLISDTRFETGSIGKSFTSVALMQLREEGAFDPQARVTDYLPWFRVRSEFAPIRMHHLLSHTAGIIRGSDFSPDQRFEVWALRDTQTSAPPGEHFHYSNIGYKTVGLVLQELTGRPYAEVIRERVLTPLGMRSTTPVITHDARRHLATPYRRFYNDRPGRPSQPLVPDTWLETDTADGCICSTPVDMAAYLRMLLNRGEGPDGRLISEESFEMLTQCASTRGTPGETPATCYGYGLMTWEENGHVYLAHSGGMVGYHAHMLGDLSDGLGAIAMINGPGNPQEIAAYALQLLSAAQRDEALPDLPPPLDPRRVANAGTYAGVYRSPVAALTLAADSECLFIERDTERIPLDMLGPDLFYADHPDFDRFMLRVARDASGRVAEVAHGPSWFISAAYIGPTSFEYPPGWDAFPGHYRSHNPWGSNFRIVLRKGKLRLVWPSESDGFDPEEELVPLAGGIFRVGIDEACPERIRFDTVLGGEAYAPTCRAASTIGSSLPKPAEVSAT